MRRNEERDKSRREKHATKPVLASNKDLDGAGSDETLRAFFETMLIPVVEAADEGESMASVTQETMDRVDRLRVRMGKMRHRQSARARVTLWVSPLLGIAADKVNLV